MLGWKPAVAAMAASLLAGAAFAAPPTPVFLAKAGASDMYERQASQLVLSSTRDPGLRRFASEMVRDHTKSTQMVKMAAMRSGIHPKPPMLDGKMGSMLADLRHARGRDRDRLYIDQQRGAHADALNLMQDYAATGSTPALRRVAADIVPVVKHHIDMLNGMH